MNKTYIFEAFQTVADRSVHFTVVHCGGPSIELHEIKADLQHHFEVSQFLPPDKIIFCGTIACSGLFQDVMASDVLGLHHFTRHSAAPPLLAACLNKEGCLLQPGGPAEAISHDLWERIQYSGLESMFRARGALLSSSDVFHYIKPSEKHCAKFIRTANVLTRGPETAFVAFCILRHAIARSALQYIYVDTSSIASLAYILALARLQLNVQWSVPLVDSFESHRGLGHAQFDNVADSLFLVSASTSGDLEHRLISEKRVARENIVTVFYLGEKKPNSILLCDITRRDTETDLNNGWELASPSYAPSESGECALCTTGSRPLAISGDQFLRQEAETKPSLITQLQKPRWLDRIMGDFYGRNIISCHRLSGIPEENAREVFVDVASAIAVDVVAGSGHGKKHIKGLAVSKTSFRVKLERLIRQITPLSLRSVLYIDDKNSQTLAHVVMNTSHLKCRPVSSRTVLGAGLRSDSPRDGAILIVCGAVVAGQRLMELSQALRTESNPIIYLVGLTRTRNEKRLEEIKKNLTPATGGSSLFYSVEDIFIPDDPPRRGSPWDREIQTLLKLRDAFVRDRRLNKILARRITAIGRAQAEGGLKNNLFWPAIGSTEVLRLRPGFALWNFRYDDPARQPAQADVYMTVSATLHHWRGQMKPVTGELVRNVLEPRNFVRFNDGVIQSSILRAAYPGELDYRENSDHGAEISSVLKVVIENYDDSRGEACFEFLLAIAEGRLMMDRDIVHKHLDQLDGVLSSGSVNDIGHVARLLTRFLIKRLNYKTTFKKNPPILRRIKVLPKT